MEHPPALDARLLHVTPVLMVSDVRAALRFYVDVLGFTAIFQHPEAQPLYAGIARDDARFHLQWHDLKGWEYPNDRPNYRILVSDVEALHRSVSGRAAACTALMDTQWKTREFHVQDPDRNGLQFYVITGG